jgi:Flp pilus assembly protein TadB
VTVGGSLFLIAVGAILYFAVTATLAGVDIQTIGLILMIVGVIGLVLSLIWWFSADRRRERVVERDRYVDPPPRY